jgi:glutamate-1-semialdehyde 2,1-aminomutase
VDVMAPLASNVALHAGVYAGNHPAMAVVVTRLQTIEDDPTVYERLDAAANQMVRSLGAVVAASALDVEVRHVGSIVEMGILGQRQRFWGDAHRLLQMYCQEHGVYFHPDPRVPWFLSTAHSPEVIEASVAVIADGLEHVAATVGDDPSS